MRRKVYDEQVIEAIKKEPNMAKVGRQLGLSRQRVWQILVKRGIKLEKRYSGLGEDRDIVHLIHTRRKNGG